MAARSGSSFLGVDVCLDEEDKLTNAPHCPHGPTLLFERFVGEESDTRHKEQYYACSASRDRKLCDFFQPLGEKVSETRQAARNKDNRSKQPWKSHQEFYQSYTETQKLKAEDRQFCHKCNTLVLPADKEGHKGHQPFTHGLSTSQLQSPSHLLRPIENKKTNAQYLFSDKAVNFLLTTIAKLGFDRVLCVGAPRIHEAIERDSSIGLQSLLLDIDHRYGQFYPPDSFCRYNMFNHYFLDGGNSQAVFSNFLCRNRGDGIIMVTDPPFGGLVDVLAWGIKWIMKEWKTANEQDNTADLPTFWVFPYFMEPRIQQSLPSFLMLDYKVDYDNHPFFRNKGKKGKKGSPVRIFTNMDASKIVLPETEGYRFCAPCNRYVSSTNQHCDVCKSCTSKDGSTYVHCTVCQRCVKPTYIHCKTCNLCRMPVHSCFNDTKIGCHKCGDMDHKRRNCPQKWKYQREQHRKQQKHQKQQEEERSIDSKNNNSPDGSPPSKLQKMSPENVNSAMRCDVDEEQNHELCNTPSETSAGVTTTPKSKVKVDQIVPKNFGDVQKKKGKKKYKMMRRKQRKAMNSH